MLSWLAIKVRKKAAARGGERGGGRLTLSFFVFFLLMVWDLPLLALTTFGQNPAQQTGIYACDSKSDIAKKKSPSVVVKKKTPFTLLNCQFDSIR
jgi:hypothetical protein